MLSLRDADNSVITNGTLADLEAAAKAILSANPGLYFGPLISGIYVAAILLGVMVHQSVLYAQHASRERLWIRFVVAFCVVGGFASFLLTIVTVMRIFVYNFGVYTAYFEGSLIAWYSLVNSLVTIAAQAVYLNRAYRLCGENKLVLLCAAPGLLAVGVGGIAACADFALHASQPTSVNTFFMVQQAATVAVDVYIVGVIVLGLRRSKSGWAHTDNLVHRLILMTLEAQLIPTLVSLVILILYAGRFATADLLGGFFGIVQAKLYAVSLLFVLNSRFTFFRTNHTQSATVSQSRYGGNFALSALRSQQPTVHVTTETHQEVFHVDPLEKYTVNRSMARDEIDDTKEDDGSEELDIVQYGNDSTTKLTEDGRFRH